jgi:hypothetical protein
MTLRTLARSSSLFMMLSASPLLAAVTPEQVWQGWQDTVKVMGNKMSADSATREGDSLVVKNLQISDSTAGTLSLGTIRLKDNGDGTVAVVLPDSYPVALHIPAPTGDGTATAAPGTPTDLGFDVNMPGAKIIASGTPDAVRYATDAPTVDVKLSSVNNVLVAALPISAEAKLTGLAGNYGFAGGTAQKFDQDFSVKSVNFAVKGQDPKTGSDYDITASLADLASKMALNVPFGADMQDMPALLAKGFSLDTSTGLGAMTFDVNVTDAGKQTRISGSTGSMSLGLAMDGDRMDYSSDSKAVSVKVVSPDIPMQDASITYGSAGFRMVVPVQADETPADFSVRMNLTDAAPSEAIWALIDPGKVLPRDPATFVIDTKGKVTMTRSLVADASSLEAGKTDAPGILNALDLNQFQVKAVGAEVTAAGNFTFDNSDTTTYQGVPAPTGKIDIKAVGVNALLDTLVKMGWIPKDQAMQGRMMLAMFANTSSTADEMTSTLEFKDKHFFANGQQLQ